MKTNPFTNDQQGIQLECVGNPKQANFIWGKLKVLHYFRFNSIMLIVLGVLCATNALAQTPTAVVKRASVTPVIDGMVDEVWAQANEYNISLPYRLETPTLGALGETTWKALWNNKGIFILVKVTDDIFSPAYDKAEGWTYDKPELWFDVNYYRKDGLGPEPGNGHYCIAPAPEKDKISGGRFFDFYPNALSYSFNVTNPS